MLFLVGLMASQDVAPRLTSNGLHGYINMSVENPPEEYGYGVSLYAAAWPLIERPTTNFQIGLASTWILPDNRSVTTPLVPHGTVARDSMPERGPSFSTVFQTIEGGLGFWASNRFHATTAKFRMNGTPDGYNHEVSTPGWDFYGNPLPAEQMGIAQLSPRVLVPPDGITFSKKTCGELFGYAWMALPLISAKKVPVVTGDQSWTLFFNAKNFRGPVAFYLPSTWSRMSAHYEPAVGRGLDALRGIANSGAIEINTVPRLVSGTGQMDFSRIPELQFPCDAKGETVLMHDMKAYSKEALWNQVDSWMKGGARPTGRFDSTGAFLPRITANPLEVTQDDSEKIRNVDRWVQTASLDDHTFGLRWAQSAVTRWKSKVQKGTFPSYFRRSGKLMEAISKTDLPTSTGLVGATFPAPDETQSYVPSDQGGGVWQTPGPKAGPFRVRLADGSVVTYYWYRFIDQPSMQNANLSEADKVQLQTLVEKIQRNWTPEKQYIAPPRRGTLASLDPAVLVKPPKGLGVGFVPIAIRQDPGPLKAGT